VTPVAILIMRWAPVTAMEAGLMVVAVEPIDCTPVQSLTLNLMPAWRSGTSELNWGGRRAATATSKETAFESNRWLSRSCGLRAKSCPGNPCGCTLVGRYAAAKAITFQVWPTERVTKLVSAWTRAMRMRGVGLSKNAASLMEGAVEPFGGAPGWLPTKSISKLPRTRMPLTSGAAKRMPMRVPRALKTVRPSWPL